MVKFKWLERVIQSFLMIKKDLNLIQQRRMVLLPQAQPLNLKFMKLVILRVISVEWFHLNSTLSHIIHWSTFDAMYISNLQT